MKVNLYLEDLLLNQRISLESAARALHTLRAKAATSEVYSCYNPYIRAVSLGGAIAVENGESTGDVQPDDLYNLLPGYPTAEIVPDGHVTRSRCITGSPLAS